MDLYLVVDIGATYTRIGIGDENKLLDKIRFQTPRVGDEYTIVNKIIEYSKRFYSKYFDRIKAIGVGTIGPLDVEKGRVINTPNLPIRSFEILDPLIEYFNKQVYVLNDAVAGVYGEKVFGIGRNYENIVYVTLSTGVGGGVIVDNNLLIGKQGNAHEIGHIVVKYDSQLTCGCGGRGHWEAYAGGLNIPRLAKHLAENTVLNNSSLWKRVLENEITSIDVFNYYRNGDLFAKQIVKEIIEACIAGLATTINLYDPDIVILSGSIFLNNIDVLYEPLIKNIDKHIVTSKPLIKPSSLGEDAVLYGALALALNPPLKIIKLQKRF
ncbi:MAG: ROK family protein [Desulfurococcaceae archaeon]